MNGTCPICGHDYSQTIITLDEEGSRLWLRKANVISNGTLINGFLLAWFVGSLLTFKLGYEYREYIDWLWEFLPDVEGTRMFVPLLLGMCIPAGISFLIVSYIEDHYNVPKYKADRDEKKAILERYGIEPIIVPYGIGYRFPEIGEPGQWGKKYGLVLTESMK